MSSEFSIESDYNFYDQFYLAPPLTSSEWNGYVMTWKDLPQVRSEIERKILEIYDLGNVDLANQLAWFYFKQFSSYGEVQKINWFTDSACAVGNFITNTAGKVKKFVKKGIEKLIAQPVPLPIATPATLLVEYLLNKDPPKSPEKSGVSYWIQSLFPQSVSPTCLLSWRGNELRAHFSSPEHLSAMAKVHNGGIKEFWDEHKKAIIIVGIVLIAAAVTIIIIATQGSGTSIAVGTGAQGIQALLDEYDSAAEPLNDANLEEGIQNFGRSIGADVTDEINRTIRVLDVQNLDIPLDDIVNQWETLVDSRISRDSLGLEPLSIFDQNRELFEFSSLTTPQSLLQPLTAQDPVFVPSANPVLPWEQESMTYFQWVERRLQEELTTALIQRGKEKGIPEDLQNDFPLFNHPLRLTNELSPNTPSLTPKIEPPVPNPTPENLARENLRNYLGNIARTMLGPNYVEPTDPAPQKSMNYITEGTRPTTWRIGGINGMATSYEEMKERREYINQFVPGQSIDWVYNKSNSPPIDLCEIFTCNYPGFSPNTAALLIDNWTKFHEENPSNPNAKYLQFCHSQGAIHLNNALMKATPDIRDRVIVVAIGPGKIVPKELCFNSFNYASKSDLVPLGALFQAGLFDVEEVGVSNRVQLALKDREQLILLDPDPDAKGMDHDFMSPTFRRIIEKHINSYIMDKGEYK